ncbi:MAG: M28 family peptidase, partial [Vicinamibacteria bacterium]
MSTPGTSGTLATLGTSVLLLASLAAGLTASSARSWDVDEARFMAHVRFLSSDKLEGRGNGEPGLETAAEYIARGFEAAGLAPGGDDGTWYQPFAVEVLRQPLLTDVVTLRSAEGDTRLAIGRQFYPLSILDRTADNTVDTLEDVPVAFAGFGIAAPGLGYDDYAGLDVRGAAVVAFTHEPQEDDERSVFGGTALTPHASVTSKAAVAAARGARLLLLVEDPSHVTDRAITANWRRDPQIEALPIPVIRVDRSRIDAALPIALDEAARAIDLTLTPQSRRFDEVRVSYTHRFARTRPTVRNVVGVMRGTHAPIAGEAVVIGGHYDHLGRSGQYSRAIGADGQIHNGADDNASGIAAILEMARAASSGRDQFGRSLVFVAFAGEELGLAGSRHYVDAPRVPLADTIAMINLDMIGRASGRVMVGGTELSPVFEHAIDSLRPLTTLTIADFSQGYADGASDNWPFIHRGIPALSFFTGFHRDYHRPSDDWDRVDPAGGVEIARLALEVAARLASPAVHVVISRRTWRGISSFSAAG